MGRRKQDNRLAKFVCEDCNNEFFVPSNLYDVIGVICNRCKSDNTNFVEFVIVEEVIEDMRKDREDDEFFVEEKTFIEPETLNEGSFYYWVSPNFKGSYRLVELVKLLDDEFCEVRLENEVFKTKRTNLKIEKI
jgi:hypothetical protein